MKLDLQDREYAKYVFFKVIDTNVRLGTLCTYNLTNVDAKYEVLEDMSMYDIIVKEKKELQIRDFLLGVKHEGVKLLTATESGGSKHSKDVIVIVNPHAKLIACKQIIQECRKKVTIKRETEYKTLFSLHKEIIETKYSIELKQFMKNTMAEPGAFKKNNFRKKYKDYTSVLKAKVKKVVVEIENKKESSKE